TSVVRPASAGRSFLQTLRDALRRVACCGTCLFRDAPSRLRELVQRGGDLARSRELPEELRGERARRLAVLTDEHAALLREIERERLAALGDERDRGAEQLAPLVVAEVVEV